VQAVRDGFLILPASRSKAPTPRTDLCRPANVLRRAEARAAVIVIGAGRGWLGDTCLPELVSPGDGTPAAWSAPAGAVNCEQITLKLSHRCPLAVRLHRSIAWICPQGLHARRLRKLLALTTTNLTDTAVRPAGATGAGREARQLETMSCSFCRAAEASAPPTLHHCGFCLPSCASYRVLGYGKLDSPRAVSNSSRRSKLEKLALEPRWRGISIPVLGCLACVTRLPVGVRYDGGGELIEARGEAEMPGAW